MDVARKAAEMAEEEAAEMTAVVSQVVVREEATVGALEGAELRADPAHWVGGKEGLGGVGELAAKGGVLVGKALRVVVKVMVVGGVRRVVWGGMAVRVDWGVWAVATAMVGVVAGKGAAAIWVVWEVAVAVRAIAGVGEAEAAVRVVQAAQAECWAVVAGLVVKAVTGVVTEDLAG